MAAQYEVRIYNRSGALQYILVPRKGLLSLGYRKVVNGVGFARFTVNASNEIVSALALDWQVEIRRRRDYAEGLIWYTDFDGLFRDEERRTNAEGISTFTAICVDSNDWLDRSIVAYKSGVSNRSTFAATNAETIAKTLVQYNATTSGGTTDGRVRDVDAWGANITIQTNGSAGNTLDYACAYRPLLQSLQEIASVGGGDFNMVKTGSVAWDFRWYNGQLGTDRSDRVIFAIEYDNMLNPTLKRTRSTEYTVAIVAGEAVGTARNVVVRTGDNYNATYNSSELYVDARDSGTALLSARGDVRLEEARARDELTFDVIQTDTTKYGFHYNLGDLVTGYYQGVTAVKQVAAVNVAYTPGNSEPENISVELADL